MINTIYKSSMKLHINFAQRNRHSVNKFVELNFPTFSLLVQRKMAFVIFLLGAFVAVCSAQDTSPLVPPMCNMDSERTVQLNEHWISRENLMDEDENGKKIMLDGEKVIELNQCHKDNISVPVRGPVVSQKMFDACKLQEICKLTDGR